MEIENRSAHFSVCGPKTRSVTPFSEWRGVRQPPFLCAAGGGHGRLLVTIPLLFTRTVRKWVTLRTVHVNHINALALLVLIGSHFHQLQVGGAMLVCCGAASCFGVTPSTSRCPSGHTMTRSKVIAFCLPPLVSGIASVDWEDFSEQSSEAHSSCSLSQASPNTPASNPSSDAKICSRSAMDVLFLLPFGRPVLACLWPGSKFVICLVCLIQSSFASLPMSSRASRSVPLDLFLPLAF